MRRRAGSKAVTPAQAQMQPQSEVERLRVVSESMLGFLTYVTDHVVATRAPMLIIDLFEHADREAVDALRCLGLIHVLSHPASWDLTWVWPTRAGCRRVDRHDLVPPAVDLLERLQIDARRRRFPDISLAVAAAAAGWDESATALPLLLLHHTAHVAIVARKLESFSLYIYDIDGFLAFDANVLRGVGVEPLHVQTAAELRVRYAEGAREFAAVLANEQDFRGAVLNDVQIHHGSLRNSDFRGASFRGATLGDFPPTRVQLGRNLEIFGLDLGAADFADVDFEGADLRGADLTDARLDGARFDTATRISEASLTRARWDVVFRDGRLVRRGQWPGDASNEARGEPKFSLVPDRAYQSWAVRRGPDTIRTVGDSGGIRLCALLLANVSRSVHVLDARAALERRPPALGELGRLKYAQGDVTDALRRLGFHEPTDAKPDVGHRLRACLRELERVDGPQRVQLLEQMTAELRQGRLTLTSMPYVANIADNLRKQGRRALTALAGDALLPLVSALEFGEICSYKRR